MSDRECESESEYSVHSNRDLSGPQRRERMRNMHPGPERTVQSGGALSQVSWPARPTHSGHYGESASVISREFMARGVWGRGRGWVVCMYVPLCMYSVCGKVFVQDEVTWGGSSWL